MASEYLLKKAREEYRPREERVLTKAEKRRNWWHYHKWHVVIGGILLLCLADILWNAFGIGKIRPDYTVAYVGTAALSDETADAIRNGFAAVSPDMNGDGSILVELVQYTSPNTGDSDALYYAQAAQVRLVADITECRSYFFLLEDPTGFQQATGALSNLDGSLPEDGDLSPDGKYLMWSDCPVLSGMVQGEADQAVASLAVARRGFWTEKRTDNADQCDELWNKLTEGAYHP